MQSMEDSYETLFQNALCGIVQVCLPLNRVLKVYKINEKAAAFLCSFGENEQMDELSIGNYMDADNQKTAIEIFCKLQKRGDCQPFLLQLYNGTIEGKAEYIRTPEGVDVVQISFLERGQEIAVRKREAAQKELLQSVLQSVRCGVVRFGYSSDEESIQLVNAAGWTMLGFDSQQQCMEQGINGFFPRVHADDRRTLLRARYTLNEELEKSHCEFRICRCESWSWLSADLQCLRNTQGNRVIQMTLTDVTDSKRLEQKKEAESSEIIQSLGTIYLTILYVDVLADSYRLIKDKSPHSFFSLSGNYTQDLHKIAEMLRVEHAENIQEQMGLARFQIFFKEQGTFLEQEFKIQKNDREVYYHIEVILTGNEAELQHVVLGIRDVTNQRLQELREHDALQSAYHAEALANRAKTEFLSRMSHDIRTPMNAIVGLSQLMREDMENQDKLKTYLNQIDGASSLLLGLINDVLDMSRIESGQVKLSSQPLQLQELLEQIRTVVTSQMQEHNHKFHMEYTVQNGEYMGDYLHLQQILTNLLSNAIKFTPDGGDIALRVWEEPDGKGVHFVVSDNGIGMTEDFQQHIFEPFERGSDVEQIQGSGLGMSIVGSLVHLMNGWIEIESKPGEGSSFHIMVPLCPHQKNEKAVPIGLKEKGHEEEERRKAPKLQGRRVLVVEDNDINRLIACRLLENMGIEVEQAEDGVQALEQFASHSADWYDMILMDVRMPNMDGYEATRKLREQPRSDARTIPIVAMTANAFAEDVHMAIQAGMNAHLAKPIQLDTLYQELCRWMPDTKKKRG